MKPNVHKIKQHTRNRNSMYVTRPLSLYRRSGSSPSLAAPEGPNSGVLVIEDGDEGAESRWCCGLFKMKEPVKELPFPQNKIVRLTHAVDAADFQYSESVYALMIPVLNQPLSSNQYYIINSHGTRKGLACTSSKEEENKSSGWCYSVPDPPPQLFDPKNAYQQFQISEYICCGGPNGFVAKSMAPDGIPPERLHRKGLRAYTQPLENVFEPTEALGLNAPLRARLPELKSPNAMAVGKWYCPFVFIREGEVGSQMTNSPYYQMTLHQNWVEIFGCEGFGEGYTGVDVDVDVEREVVSVYGEIAENKNVGDGFVWFERAGGRVGLSMAIVERVKWEEERVGFVWAEKEKKVKVKRREEFKGVGMWKRFGCYVLIERFVLKRMDGTLVLAWEFRHTHQVRIKWE